MPVKLHEHQEKAVSKLSDGKILKGGVGTGKTHTALAYYLRRTPKGESYPDLYVITTAKKRDNLDWQKEAAANAIGLTPDESITGANMVIDSWNNIGKYMDVKNAFFIFDEQRLVGSGKWAHTFARIAKANNWIMLTATPGDSWIDYIPVFLANGFYKNRTEFKKRHVVYSPYSKYPRIEGYREVGHLVRLRNSILVEMPYVRHTVRKFKDVMCEYDIDLMKQVKERRWNIYESRPLKDIAELFRISRRLVNSDKSRMNNVISLMQKHPKLIVFYNFDYELDQLRLLGDVPQVSVSEWNGHKHEEIPDTDRWVYLVQYAAGAEGWNCIETDAMVFYSLTYSYRMFHQGQGRIDRLNTPFNILYYYILRSNSWIDVAIMKALKNKKSFNESEYKV